MKRNVKVMFTKLRILVADFLAVIGHSWDLDKKRSGTELNLINLMEFGIELLKTWLLNSQKPFIQCSGLPVPLKEGNYEAKEGARRLSNSTVVNRTLNYSCAPSCLRISLWQIYARRYPKIPWLQGNQKHMQHKILWKRWKFPPNLVLPTLEPMNSDDETCCQNTSRNSNNYLTLRSYPNYALTLVCKLSKEDYISSHLIQKDQEEWYTYAENIRCLVTIWDLEQEAGFVRIRKLAQCWTSTFVIMKIVTVLKFISDLCFKTTASCIRTVNGIEKYVKETTETMENEKHGVSGKPIAKARPRLKSTIMLTRVSVPLRERKWVDVNLGSYDHVCYVILKAMTRLLRHDQNIPQETGGAVKYEDIVEDFNKEEEIRGCFAMVTQWLDFYSGKRRTSQEKVSILLESYIFQTHFVFQSKSKSGGSAVDPELQDNVLLPQGFTEYIYHVRNLSEVHSIIRSGLIPVGQSLRRWRQSVFFTTANPIDCSIQKYLETASEFVYWCNLKLVQEKGLPFHRQGRMQCPLRHTTSCVCIEVVCMKTKDELFHKVRLTPKVPRVVLKSNSQIGLQDQQGQDARTSCDQPRGSKLPWETGRNTVEYRIPGVPLSAV